MEKKDDIFYLMKKVNFIYMNNTKNKTIINPYIKFTEKYLLILDLLKEFDPLDSEEKKLYLANAVMLLIKQCEILYRTIMICISNKFDKIISETVEKMKTTKEYKAIVKEFLLQLLNNNKIEDLAYLLVLLKNVEIRKQTSPIVKEYIPKVITLAAADTAFYSRKGLIKGEEKLVFNPDYILINVWSSMTLEAQKEALEHELTHIIVYPSITVEGIDNHQQMEDTVENYLASLRTEQEQNNNSHNNSVSERIVSVDQIIRNLKQQGFKILKQDNELIAFCEERNIVFFCRDMVHILENYEGDKWSYYQQPYITYDGDSWVGFFAHFKNCRKVKTQFPLFTESNYLWLYKLTDKDSPFISSMKRIASIPELYNAVGYENQQLIDRIVSENTKTTKR